jgi:hypothetical protein
MAPEMASPMTGMPKGSNDKLAEAFGAYLSMYQSWREGGRDALDRRPVEFIKIVVSVLSKQAGMAHGAHNPFETMSDEDLELGVQLLQKLVHRNPSIQMALR